ncbi:MULTISPECIES: class I adenylate-forming enzyme family protein [Bacillus]|uniref:Long-chain fatty acid--CoA ligase n=1 Tax=Bacillus infantis NRRL B-14911 TaxID=1367477 RepID=U5L7G8_9BACI|nr:MULTISPECIES: long-chain fatty acid--CoA ligase [Bacillus]AGX03370.1 long-chain fatty acid--CoA ligase [Bacillus infantis NRRL B-14911]EAR66292.1 putative long-chain fatty-acid-CoA ligase [Bacillus sp. NRRL B-14911]
MWREIDWLTNRAGLSPGSVAVIDAEQGKSWTYKELNSRAEALAGWLLERGAAKGDRIALLAPNHISCLDFLFACGKIGAIFVPVNWRLAAEEIQAILADCTPVIIGYHYSFIELASRLQLHQYESVCLDETPFRMPGRPFIPPWQVDEEDPLAMIYTGGTTGKPKGAVLSHRAILWNAVNTAVSWGLTNQDTTITYLPMFHTGGINALTLPLLLAGGKVVLAGNYNPSDAARYIREYQCTIILLVPTMYHMLIDTDEFKEGSFESMRVFLSGGAPCPLSIYEEFRRKGLHFKEGYGMTEAGPNNFYISPQEAVLKKGSIGRPMLFNTVKILAETGVEAGNGEVGEVLIKGRHVFSCYWNNEEATKDAVRDGWLYTGDLAKVDDEGFFYIVGRKKDMIITGGENVYPLEVEQWLGSCPQVDEVSVIGIDDRKWGEAVTAFIVLKEAAAMTKDEIKGYCRQKLAAYKVPKFIYFLDKLPKTHVGKIDKKQLKMTAAEMAAAKEG